MPRHNRELGMVHAGAPSVRRRARAMRRLHDGVCLSGGLSKSQSYEAFASYILVYTMQMDIISRYSGLCRVQVIRGVNMYPYLWLGYS